MIFILSFVICELVSQILENARKKGRIIAISIITMVCCIGNLKCYMTDTRYIWKIDYRQNNEKLSKYINDNYENSIVATNVPVRGYMNLLFGRGIYECCDNERIINIASKKEKEYAIEIEIGNNTSQKMYQLSGATVYCLSTGEIERLKVKGDGIISVVNNDVNKSEKGYTLADWTDNNWIKGYSNTQNILLFYLDDNLLKELMEGDTLVCGEECFEIVNVDYDEKWIRVSVDRDASACMYSEKISVK